MSDLQSLYSQATKLMLSLREGVERLEAADERHLYNNGMLSMLSNDMYRKLDELRRISTAMDAMWRMSVVKEASAKRDVWKRKVRPPFHRGPTPPCRSVLGQPNVGHAVCRWSRWARSTTCCASRSSG